MNLGDDCKSRQIIEIDLEFGFFFYKFTNIRLQEFKSNEMYNVQRSLFCFRQKADFSRNSKM